MATYADSIAAATAVVGYDLLSNLPFVRSSGSDRTLAEVGIAGSAAALDTKIGIFVGGSKIGQLFNQGTGGIQNDRDMNDFSDAFIPAGEALALMVEDAPATNPINYQMSIDEMEF